MNKIIIIVCLLTIISRACYPISFDGFVWIDLSSQQRLEYIQATIQAAKELPLQYKLDADTRDILRTIEKGAGDKNLQEIAGLYQFLL